MWPLAESQCVTSTFGDYRPGHFHSGIDLSTGGREGLAVRAAERGWVCRVRTSCMGYGKAVYVRLQDGRTAVYAHLSRFSPPIARAIEEAQIEAGRYEVEIRPRQREILVERGEVIGYTGQTGAGPPHLHFELRDDREHPINPLMHGVSIEDGVAPILSRLIVRPLDMNSFVNGQRRDRELGLDWEPASGCYTTRERLVCSGRIGILVEGYDHTDPCRRNLSLNALTLEVDGRTVFRTCFGEFGYDETGRIDTYYDRKQRRERSREFHRLYRGKGNGFSFGDPYGEWAGVIEYRAGRKSNGGITPGPHQLEIRAEDAAGNVARARLEMILNERPETTGIQVQPRDGGLEVRIAARDPDGDIQSVHVVADIHEPGKRVARDAEFQGVGWFRTFLPGIGSSGAVSIACTAVDGWGSRSTPGFASAGESHEESGGGKIDVGICVGPTLDHLEISIEVPALLTGLPRVWSPNMGWSLPDARVEQIHAHCYRAVVPLTREFNGSVVVRAAGRDLAGRVVEGSGERQIWNISPETGGCIRSPGGEFTATVEPGQVFEDLWFTVVRDVPWAGAQEIRPIGPAFIVEPMDAVFSGKVTVAMPWDEDTAMETRPGICSCQENSDLEWVGGEIDAAVLGASVRYLTRFCLAVDEIPPKVGGLEPRDGSRVPGGRSIVLRARASDKGSGLDCSSVGMEIDSRTLIVEFDPELDLMVSCFARSLAAGRHTLLVWAEDRAGNRSEAISTFWVD